MQVLSTSEWLVIAILLAESALIGYYIGMIVGYMRGHTDGKLEAQGKRAKYAPKG